jgi:hypothetical protein
LNSKKLIFGFAFIMGLSSFAQSARVKGVILDQNNQPIANVNVFCSGGTAQSNAEWVLSAFQKIKISQLLLHMSLLKKATVPTLKNKRRAGFNLVMNNNKNGWEKLSSPQ